MRTVTSSIQAADQKRWQFVSSAAADMFAGPECAFFNRVGQAIAMLSIVMGLYLIAAPTRRANAKALDTPSSDPDPRCTSNALVRIYSMVRARKMIWLCCLSTMAVFLAGCASTQKNLELIKESPSYPDFVDPVAKVLPSSSCAPGDEYVEEGGGTDRGGGRAESLPSGKASRSGEAKGASEMPGQLEVGHVTGPRGGESSNSGGEAADEGA